MVMIALKIDEILMYYRASDITEECKKPIS